MPQRISNIFDGMTSVEALYRGYYRARRGKRGKVAVANFERDLGANIMALHESLCDGSYAPQPYRKFEVTEPKRRVIYAPAFQDVVVQHAIYEAIYPVFDRTFIEQSYACRIGYGTHKAADKAQHYLRQCKPDDYVLKLDIRRFFYRIDRDALRSLIEAKVKDRRAVELMMQFTAYEEPLGLPIGNLLSQLFALIYLNKLDHFVKRELKIKRYVRYVDDFVLFGLSLDRARELKDRIEAWLWQELRLEYSKWTIQKAKRGVNFVGYRAWNGTRFIRKHSLVKFGRCLKTGNDACLRSILAHALHTGSRAHLLERLKTEAPDAYARMPKTLTGVA